MAIGFAMLRSMPTVPEASKWTNTGPCVDWFWGLASVHNMVGPLFNVAFSTLAATMVLSGERGPRVHGVAEGYKQDINWNAVHGKRLVEGLKFLTSVEHLDTVIELGAVMLSQQTKATADNQHPLHTISSQTDIQLST